MFKTVKRIIDWCGEFKGRLYVGLVCSFFSTWFVAAPVMIAAYTIGMIIDDARGKAVFDEKWIMLSIVLIAASIFCRFLLDYIRARFQESISFELVARDRLAIGDILKRVSLGYFEKVNTGEILNAVTTGLDTLETMGIRMIDTIIGSYINCLCMFLCIAFFSPSVSLIILMGVALSFLFLIGISNKSTEYAPVAAKANKDLSSAAIEYARGLSVVKSFGQAGASVSSMKKACRDSRNINVKVELGFNKNNCAHVYSLKLASVGLVAAAAYLTLVNSMPFPVMIMFCMFSFLIFEGVESISDSAHVMGIIENAMNELDKLKSEKFIDKDGKDIKLNHFDIEFKDVSFGYGKRNIINDVSFKIREHSATAIVGPSGSGKTTLCNLLARFYDVNSGQIKIGNHNIKEMTCESLLSNIAMVFQNVYLFNDTIANNISFGKPDATKEEIIEAAKKACCHDFIMELPDGYDTMVGEGGSSLSGGQKQRISIARAILKDAPIIILDEATASIDPENEHLIQSAISELTNGKTIIIIAHRLATIENADQILVVENGKIVEKGTHKELIKHNGLYKRFIGIREEAEGWNISAV